LRAEDVVVARAAAADDFMNKLNGVKSNLESMVVPTNVANKAAVQADAWAEVVVAVNVQINVLVGIFTDNTVLALLDITVVVSILSGICINIATLLHAAVLANVGLEAQVKVGVQLFATLLSHIGSSWSPLCQPLYNLINLTVVVELLASIQVGLDVCLKIVISIGVGLGL